ncbi:MAG TPA: aminotransferase class III-fold pyridoxal phosphate-dependent enzyme [Solirubrobacterales bacterium]|nr:aminotransferase class III-fold pyridoxal phosphate-dependent enzyme [Solirubrobacterales bacterium]
MTLPSAVFEAQRRRMAPGLALAAKHVGAGAVEQSADGAVVRLSDGRELIDFGSYGVTLLGHRHPAVTAAVREQLGRMPTATRTLANPTTAAFADELAELILGRLHRFWLGSDGADVVEVAVKLARLASSRRRVLAVEHGFHGKTLGALALTWNPAFREGLAPLLQNVTHLRRDDLEGVARETAGGDVAALIFEPVQGEAGARCLDREVLRRWTRDAHAAGAFVISDEVQAGLRRCGPWSVALDAGLDVDAVLFGKALGGGVMPLAALAASAELYEPLRVDPNLHSATFGGHPLACAAGRAALPAIEGLAEPAAAIAARLDLGLRRLADAHPGAVVAVHGEGLMRGLELATPGAAGSVFVDLAHAGLLVSPCLGAPGTIRLLPSMVTTDTQLECALELLDEALAQVPPELVEATRE